MPKLEHFAIYADDSPALKDFYVAAFGMRVVFESGGDPPAYFLADDAGMALEIIGRPRGESNANQRWVCHIAFWVEDADYARVRGDLEARGIVFETDTGIHNESLRTDFFTDPAGNRAQIVWRRQRLGE